MSTRDENKRERVSFGRFAAVIQVILSVVMILYYIVAIGQSCT